jgi:hypothetical protein
MAASESVRVRDLWDVVLIVYETSIVLSLGGSTAAT